MDVFIDKCDDYEKSYKVVQEAFDSLGGIERFVEKGEIILVKPNLLKGASPEDAVTTHPDFITAVVKLLEEEEVNVVIADSPAGRTSEGKLKKHYEKSGWLKVEEETEAVLAYEFGKTNIGVPKGNVKKSFELMELVEEVDGIINLPKLKTHSLTVFTGAVKNLYGLVPGLAKAAYHGQFMKLNDFGRMLLDLERAVETRISIMDGILAMEGSGPSGGEPVELEAVLASKDPISCDYAACELAGIPIQKVPTLTEADIDFDSIEYVNRKPSSFDQDLKYPPGGSQPVRIPNFLAGLFSNFYLDRPELLMERCTKCWACEEMCPKDAIKRKDYGPKISWWKCIRCYCCKEVCPVEALDVG